MQYSGNSLKEFPELRKFLKEFWCQQVNFNTLLPRKKENITSKNIGLKVSKVPLGDSCPTSIISITLVGLMINLVVVLGGTIIAIRWPCNNYEYCHVRFTSQLIDIIGVK